MRRDLQDVLGRIGDDRDHPSDARLRRRLARVLVALRDRFRAPPEVAHRAIELFDLAQRACADEWPPEVVVAVCGWASSKYGEYDKHWFVDDVADFLRERCAAPVTPAELRRVEQRVLEAVSFDIGFTTLWEWAHTLAHLFGLDATARERYLRLVDVSLGCAHPRRTTKAYVLLVLACHDALDLGLRGLIERRLDGLSMDPRRVLPPISVAVVERCAARARRRRRAHTTPPSSEQAA